jgi:DNA-binding transcriptional LysR family regulator
LPNADFGDERVVLVMRTRHPFRKNPSLDRYCNAQHMVVSLGGDAHGFVDQVLAKADRSRRVALTVPNFMFALAIVAETDLICAVPKKFAAAYAARFGLVAIDAPLPLASSN